MAAQDKAGDTGTAPSAGGGRSSGMSEEFLPGRRLAYLSLETPLLGQAAYTHIHEIVAGLRERGWRVELIVAEGGGASAASGLWARALGYWRAQKLLWRSLPQQDAVFMRAHFAALPLSWICQRRGIPVFQEVNGQPGDVMTTYPWLRAIGALLRYSYRAQLRWADHVFAVTDGLACWAQEQSGHTRVSVVANGANVRVFHADGLRPDGEGRYVAFVGGLAAWHGIATMIAATRDPAWPEDVRLIVIGDGVERDAMRHAELGKRVTWLGRRPQKEAAAYLRGAVAALSVTEDRSGHLGSGVAPLKLFEAMASGTPVIVSDLPYQKDIVLAHETGLVIPMGDAAALARAVARLATNPQEARRLGANGADYVAAHASWAARAGEVARTMEAALQGRSSRAGPEA